MYLSPAIMIFTILKLLLLAQRITVFLDLVERCWFVSYIVEEPYPWLGNDRKMLHLKEDFSQASSDNFQMDPAEQLKLILRKWQEIMDHPSLPTLNGVLEKLGLKDLIPEVM